MSRPLLITDCDEVLLHMVAHFATWLDETHAIDFWPKGGQFDGALRRRGDGGTVTREDTWPLLDGFFDTEMHRQTLVPHAREALARVAAAADVVVLTNLGEQCHAGRVAQLEAVGIRHEVICNSGGKGVPVAALVADRRPDACVFVDDLAVHHESVARHAPEVWRLHMIAEPRLAAEIAPAAHAHARIDDWADALPWVLEKLAGAPAA